MKSNKKGISLAEVMIVVAIIAIVAVVFLSMPKKKVSKYDKAKYYAAYTMLKNMQDGMLARSTDGTAAPKDDDDAYDFCTNAVNKWLNVLPNDHCGCDAGNCSVTLINGMTMTWSGNTSADNSRPVTIDLDGPPMLGNLKDMHEFTLYNTPSTDEPYGLLVIPDTAAGAAGNTSDWIEFRVYRLDGNDGRKNYTGGTARSPYNTAIDIYNNCNSSYNNTCFIEAKKPF